MVLNAANWQTGVGVTVTAVDDAISDGAQPCTVQTDATSSDTDYNGRSVADVSVTVNDDDVPGVILAKSSASVDEGGPNDTYTVRLRTIPTATVTIAFTPGAQLQAITSLTFAADATALTPQTVTVRAVDDTVVEGDHSDTISHSVSGGGYNSAPFTPGNSVTVAISDNDIRYTLAAPGDVTEGNGGVQTTAFTVTRTGDITRSSTVNFGLSGTATNGTDYNNVTPAPGTLTFTAGVTQEIIALDVVGDYVDENNEVITLTLSSATGTGGGGTSTVSGSPADVLILDNDTANIALSPTSLTVSEPDTTGVFTITLGSQPTSAVTVTMMVSDLSECTLSRSSAALDAANWQTGVTVTVTALDDAAADGAQSCDVVTNAAASADPDYNGQNPANVAVTVNDDDIPGVQVSPLNLTVAEPAGTAVFTLSLATLPTGSAAVTVPLTSTCAVVPASVTIPFAAWDSGVTVTVTALDDEIDNQPERSCAVTTGSPTSPAAEYEALSVTVTDDDITGFIIVPDSGQTGEDGRVFTFTVRLGSRPTGNVVIDVTSSNPAAGAASPTQLTFTPLTWGRAQTITVTGQDDGDNPAGDASYTVDLTVNGSTADPAYAVVATAAVTVTNRDNDVPPVYLPLILRGFTSGPDLVIDSLSAGSGGPEVVIRNAGNAPVVDAFWVDVYFNPTETPGLNKTWPMIAPAGAVWGVTQTLAPDEELTLTVGGAYYDAGRSSASFPAGAQVYGYVDSVNQATNYGGVLEIDETNNLAGPVASTAEVAGPLGAAADALSAAGLPNR